MLFNALTKYAWARASTLNCYYYLFMFSWKKKKLF